MSFLPDDYEPVADRIRAFYKDHPQGRIITDCISLDSEQVTFRASVYREIDPDPHPAATGHAHGLLTRRKAVEFIETVSIGRALRNLNYSADGGSSREEMQEFNEEMQEFNEVKHQVGNARGPQAKQRASEPITENQLPLAKRLLGDVHDGVNIVTEQLGEYRPPEIWSKYEAMGLIDALKKAKEEQMGGKQPSRSKGKDDSEWVEVPF